MNQPYHLKHIKKAMKNRVPYVQEAKGIYAVLLLLVEMDGETCLLYEMRADALHTQPSEICFPGGRVEQGEALCDAVLRETWEEIGILPEDVNIITQLDLLQDVSGRAIYPFLGSVDAKVLEHMTVNADEVQEVFLVPLSFLKDNPPYVYKTPVVMQIGEDFPYEKIGFQTGYAWRNGSLDVPIYEFKHYRIWGITARMTRWLIHVLEQEGIS